MKNTLILLSLVALIFWTTGCTPYYYVSPTHNVPKLEKKGDVAFNGQLNNFSQEIQGAAAINNNIGLLFNYMSAYDSRYSSGYTGYFISTPSSFDEGGGQIAEFGIGHFDTLGKNMSFALYGLYGTGLGFNNFEHSGRLDYGIQTISFQPSIAYRRKHFEAIVAAKVGNLSFINPTGDLAFQTDQETGSDIPERELMSAHGSGTFVESSLTLRTGFKNVKLQGQLGFGSVIDNQWMYERVELGTLFLGVAYTFNYKNLLNK